MILPQGITHNDESRSQDPRAGARGRKQVSRPGTRLNANCATLGAFLDRVEMRTRHCVGAARSGRQVGDPDGRIQRP